MSFWHRTYVKIRLYKVVFRDIFTFWELIFVYLNILL